MFLGEGVEVTTSADATSSVVSKLVDVETVVPWLQAFDTTSHFGFITTLQR